MSIERFIDIGQIMKIAFYAPLKSPEHAVPSGDRQMARALIKALKLAGHEVELVSHFRSFSKTPHDQKFYDQAMHEADKIIESWADHSPDLWFSYHPYYKAPDFIALEILQSKNIPIVTAEASLANKRDCDEWQKSQECVRSLLNKSQANFYFTDRDLPGLRSALPSEKLTHLPPFIDIDIKANSRSSETGPIKLITMGMMREGVKVDSYLLLASALKNLADTNWHLTVIGDGKKRGQVESLFAGFSPNKLTWLGEIKPDEVSKILTNGDVFVWPGFGEAYGLAYLEAQAAGLPVVALNTHGVPYAVQDGETGILVLDDDDKAFSIALRTMIENKTLRKKYGKNAQNFIHTERNLTAASKILDTTISRIFQ